ncbi:MAG: rhodanese-like domain-containing protein [Eubacteriales bacterium]|nr:rhodanese-like domain-containing protein [Eubacteriales bacterium]
MNCELIGQTKFDYYVDNPYSVIIDVRNEELFQISHIFKAVNIPYNKLSDYIRHNIKDENNIDILTYKDIFQNKRKTYVIYCEKGTNSLIIGNMLGELGYFTKSLVGGIIGYHGRYLVNNDN